MEVKEINFDGWGGREINLAIDLIKLWQIEKAKTQYFNRDELKICFNMWSATVFLSDSDYNVAVEEDGYLQDFLVCGECGCEGTIADLINECSNDCCCKMI